MSHSDCINKIKELIVQYKSVCYSKIKKFVNYCSDILINQLINFYPNSCNEQEIGQKKQELIYIQQEQVNSLRDAFKKAFEDKIEKIKENEIFVKAIQQKIYEENIRLSKTIFEGAQGFLSQGRIYDALNISRSANTTEIRKSYRKLSPFLHKDKLPKSMSNAEKETRHKALEKLNTVQQSLFYHGDPNYVDDRNPLKPIQEARDLKQKDFEIALKASKEASQNYRSIKNSGSDEEIKQAQTKLKEAREELNWIRQEKNAAISDYNEYHNRIKSTKNNLVAIFNKNVAKIPTDQSLKKAWNEEKRKHDKEIVQINSSIASLKGQLVAKKKEEFNDITQFDHKITIKLTEFKNFLDMQIRAFAMIQSINCEAECRSNNTVPNPYLESKVHKSCFDHSKLENIFTTEGTSYSALLHELQNPIYIQQIKQNVGKIPKLLHSVWFVPEICQGDSVCIASFFEQQNKYLLTTSISKEWIHYLWTNDVKSMLQVNKSYLKNITIKSLSELSFNAYYHETQWKLSLAVEIWARNDSSLAANVAKFLVLQKYGGVYMNSDIQLVNSSLLSSISDSYNSFFITTQYENNTLLDDRFLGVTPNNIIINGMLDLLVRNIFEVYNTPDFVRYPCSNFARMIATTGLIPLSVSFTEQFKALHEHLDNGNTTNVNQLVQCGVIDKTIVGEILYYYDV